MWKAEIRDSLRKRRNQERVSRGEPLRLRKGAQMVRISESDQWRSCLTSVRTGFQKSMVILSSGAEWGSSICSRERLKMLPIFDNRTIEQSNNINPYNMQSPIEYIKRSLSGSRPIESKPAGLSPDHLYYIRCLSNNFYLREQLRAYKLSQGDRVRVIGGELTPSKPVSYLWMFKPNKDDSYQIIHFRTDLSLVCSQYRCHLEFGSLSSRQKFRVQTLRKQFSSEGDVTLIVRIKEQNDNYIELDGVLQMNDYSERDLSQEFALIKKMPEQIMALKGTGEILSKDRSHALDLTNASRLSQNDIILYEKNHRMNQHWVFENVKEGELRVSFTGLNIPIFHIRSALTEQFVSYSKEQERLVQSSYPQEWRLKQIEPEKPLFCIEHVKLNLYLNYDPEDFSLIMGKKECYWEIPQWKTALTHSRFSDI